VHHWRPEAEWSTGGTWNTAISPVFVFRVSLSLRLKDLLGPVTKVKKKKAQGPSRTCNESKEEEEEPVES